MYSRVAQVARRVIVNMYATLSLGLYVVNKYVL